MPSSGSQGSGSAGGSVQRPITRAFVPSRSGRVWMPLFIGATALAPSPLVPTNIVRAAPHVKFAKAMGGYASAPLATLRAAVQQPHAAAALRRFEGRVWLPRGPNLLPPYPNPLPSVLRPKSSPRRLPAGRVWQPRGPDLPPPYPSPLPLVLRPVSSPRRITPGRVLVQKG